MYQVRDTVKILHSTATGLAEALKSGKGYEETLPRYKRLKSLQRDAAGRGPQRRHPRVGVREGLRRRAAR